MLNFSKLCLNLILFKIHDSAPRSKIKIYDFIIFVRRKSLYLLPNDIYIINNIDLVIICELQTTYPLQST